MSPSLLPRLRALWRALDNPNNNRADLSHWPAATEREILDLVGNWTLCTLAGLCVHWPCASCAQTICFQVESGNFHSKTRISQWDWNVPEQGESPPTTLLLRYTAVKSKTKKVLKLESVGLIVSSFEKRGACDLGGTCSITCKCVIDELAEAGCLTHCRFGEYLVLSHQSHSYPAHLRSFILLHLCRLQIVQTIGGPSPVLDRACPLRRMKRENCSTCCPRYLFE